MGSKNEEEEVETEENLQKINDPQMNSNSSCIKIQNSYDPKGSSSNFDPKLLTSTDSFCKLLEGVVEAANSAVSIQHTTKFQEQFGMSPQVALANSTSEAGQAAQIHPNTELRDESAMTSTEHASPAHRESSIQSLSVMAKEERMQSFEGQDHLQEGNYTKSLVEITELDSSNKEILGTKPEPVTPSSFSDLLSVHEKNSKPDSNEDVDDVLKTPKLDGYCWRKYGQKQVKSSGSSRSYYRCTNLSCHAKKKVEQSDVSGEIVNVVYKGNHTHDPPQSLNKSLSRKKASSNSSMPKSVDRHLSDSGTEQRPVPKLTSEGDDNLVSTVGTSQRTEVEDLHSKTPDTEARFKIEPVMLSTEVVPVRSCNTNEHKLVDTMKERDVPFKKRRIKETGKSCSEPVYRTFKEPEVVVQAAGDAGLSSDGYRWRKYGQKMVKGNVYPRSYYRCSSAGCPVRKHVERATDGSLTIVAMYEGKHNHDMPVPRKQHVSPKASIVSSTGEASTGPLPKSDSKPSSPAQGSPTQNAVEQDKNLGGDLTVSGAASDKVIESAQTLVGVGIELKSC